MTILESAGYVFDNGWRLEAIGRRLSPTMSYFPMRIEELLRRSRAGLWNEWAKALILSIDDRKSVGRPDAWMTHSRSLTCRTKFQ
jgi:hypothetical protein